MDTEENYTIELIKWTKNKHCQVFCFTLAYWRYKDGYELRFVDSRPFDNIDIEDIVPIWKQLAEAQKNLDDFEIYDVFEEFE